MLNDLEPGCTHPDQELHEASDRRDSDRQPAHIFRRQQLLLTALAPISAGAGGCGAPPPERLLPALITSADHSAAAPHPVDWGESKGYPSSTAEEHMANPEGLSDLPAKRVGDYSGGYERHFPHNTIRAPREASRLLSQGPLPLTYAWRGKQHSRKDYLDRFPVTGVLLAHGGTVLAEEYRFQRTAEMRMQSWSMAKSVTSLLLGICIDHGLVRSLDDTAEQYCEVLRGTLHGGTTLRNLANMSSGAATDHAVSNVRIYTDGLSAHESNIASTVARWNNRAAAGKVFNYNELCPLTIGMVIRAVTAQSLSAFAEQALWMPMGAEGDATWLTDSNSAEFNCIGFGARLRDWARLGLLVARRGVSLDGRRVVGDCWFDELCAWTPGERELQQQAIEQHGFGYKALLWHIKPDGTQPRFFGGGGQTILVDMASETVLVQTAVSDNTAWEPELLAIFEAAVLKHT
eukprot:SAG11_NODE_1683_length_4450_cov_2.569984_4_plen_461_part_00